MKKLHNLFSRIQLKNKYERCVLCHKATLVERHTPIELRDFYIEGIGQLCISCCFEMGIIGSNNK